MISQSYRMMRTRAEPKKKSGSGKRKSAPKRAVPTKKGKEITLKNGRKVTHTVKVRDDWTLEDYRRAHKTIPGDVYEVKDTDTKIIKKKTYAPLGRPPADRKKRQKYNEAKLRMTPHGQRYDRHKRSHAKVDRPTAAEVDKYLRAQDRYDSYNAGRYYSSMDDIEENLEDMGYSDKRKHWRKMSDNNKKRALYEEEYSNYRQYMEDKQYY